jgi:hypothetical protein
VLDILVQNRRNAKATKRLRRKLLKKQGVAPRVMITDNPASYGAARREIMPGVDIFAPAFIISGNRLRTPQASCRIKSAKPMGDRQLLVLDCANAVAGNEVRVLMAPDSDGALRRYFNEQDTTGTKYERCSR